MSDVETHTITCSACPNAILVDADDEWKALCLAMQVGFQPAYGSVNPSFGCCPACRSTIRERYTERTGQRPPTR